ncbi:MAG: hypothetical protein WDZ51_13220 [Pirellulaceae bacterium]
MAERTSTLLLSESADPAIPAWWRDWRFFLLLVIALVARAGVGLASWENLQADPDSYRRLAANILEQQSFTLSDPAEPTAFRPILYPLLLAWVSRSGLVLPAEVFGLHLVLGLLTVAGAYALARKLDLAKWRLWAGLLVAFDPILMHQATLVMNETLSALLAVTAWLALLALIDTVRGDVNRIPPRELTIRGVNLGGALLLAFYCRPTFVIWAALAPLTLLGVEANWGRRGQAVAAVGLTCLFLLAPWVVRNIMIFDAPVIATTHGGYTLLWGNNREYYDHLKEGHGDIWDSSPFHARFGEAHPHKGTSASELARDRAANREAVRTISDQPGMFAYSSLLRLASFWRPWPLPLSEEESFKRRMLRYAVGAWYWVLLPLAACGCWQLGRNCFRPEWLAGLLLPITFTAIHLVYWTDMRMRAPVMPVIAVLACVALNAAFERYRSSPSLG